MDKVDIYVCTDIKGIRKAAGHYIWLIEMKTPKGPVTLYDKKETEAVTGRIAELTALTEALGRITKPCEITFHIANNNLIRAFKNQWLDAWRASGWMDCKGEPVKDAEKWKLFDERASRHTILGVTDEAHSYSSWMNNELGIANSETSQSRIEGSYATISEFKDLLERLEPSDFDGNEELQTLINGVCELLFTKFRISQRRTNTGTVRMENP